MSDRDYQDENRASKMPYWSNDRKNERFYFMNKTKLLMLKRNLEKNTYQVKKK
jgi:hypothetical protein